MKRVALETAIVEKAANQFAVKEEAIKRKASEEIEAKQAKIAAKVELLRSS